ncbi:MAG TPA: class I SAM-dependent methyltransferase [Candidatus Paceibacterota bacterium]
MDTSIRAKKGYGDFGSLSTNYAKARKGFPDESIDFIFEKIGQESPRVLDLGCGTGIATEQLHEKSANVFGTDIDADMIRLAQGQGDSRSKIKYQVAPAEKQPFANDEFDTVTAFSAFHWFTTKEALDEIKRVLKPRGIFFAINKNEIDNFKKENRRILQQFVERELPDAKKEYDSAVILKENGFRNIDKNHFPVTEYFSPSEAVEYVQTMSIWNLVPENKRSEARKKFSEHFKQIAKGGKVERRLEVVIVSGQYFE